MTYGPDHSIQHMAVASLWEVTDKYGRDQVQVIMVSYDSEPYIALMSEAQARQAIKHTIQELERRGMEDQDVAGLRRVQGGSWVCRIRCPDGEVRQFMERRPSTKREPRVGLSATTRWTVLERDGFTCRYCGRKAPDVELVIDHAVSVIDGGTDDETNLVAACVDCNGGKGRRSIGGGAT